MKTFLISATMTVSCTVEVKAEDAISALEEARAFPPAIEKDGTPEDLSVEEMA